MKQIEEKYPKVKFDLKKSIFEVNGKHQIMRQK